MTSGWKKTVAQIKKIDARRRIIPAMYCIILLFWVSGRPVSVSSASTDVAVTNVVDTNGGSSGSFDMSVDVSIECMK